MIPLLRFLARSSPGVVAVSIVAGAASGASGVALIALIQAELAREAPGSGRLGAAFATLCLVSGVSRVVAQAAMVRLGQGAVALLTREVAGRILALPLRAFEAMDRSSLLAVLTEDIALIGGAVVGVPQVCINGPDRPGVPGVRRLAGAGRAGGRGRVRRGGHLGVRRGLGPGRGEPPVGPGGPGRLDGPTCRTLIDGFREAEAAPGPSRGVLRGRAHSPRPRRSAAGRPRAWRISRSPGAGRR